MLIEQELYQYVQIFVCLFLRQLWILICSSLSSPPPKLLGDTVGGGGVWGCGGEVSMTWL